MSFSHGGIIELAEEVFQCPTPAQPEYLGVKSPIYSTAVGIIHYVNRNHSFEEQLKALKKEVFSRPVAAYQGFYRGYMGITF